MKCPACGDHENQRRIGRINGVPHTAYHCEACDELYVAMDPPEDEAVDPEE
ncbi:MAG TPA: hypothetical protein VG826_33065 [Pirellulales bacterium]|nr:hypothetical protein [Pirellulales bacterium]